MTRMAMEITDMLQRVQSGDRQALNDVIPLVYAELKKLAAAQLRREGSPVTIETAALVHEAFLRLVTTRHPAYENRSHFYGIASRLMRQILVEMARGPRHGKTRCRLPGSCSSPLQLSLRIFPCRKSFRLPNEACPNWFCAMLPLFWMRCTQTPNRN